MIVTLNMYFFADIRLKIAFLYLLILFQKFTLQAILMNLISKQIVNTGYKYADSKCLKHIDMIYSETL